MSTERRRSVDVFGGTVDLRAAGSTGGLDTPAALVVCAALLHRMHDALTRFDDASELSRLNADPRTTVPATAIVRRFAALVPWAGQLSDGLVDATQLAALEATGYRKSLEHKGCQAPVMFDAEALPAIGDPRRDWARVSVDDVSGTVSRPPGVRLDAGGLGKGLAADLVAERLDGCDSFAVGCLGDVRVGGRKATPRAIDVTDPFGGPTLARLMLTRGAIATSGVTARSYTGPGGRPAHHIIDPGRGTSAWTGVLQVTALARTTVEAEVRAKTALLVGPEHAAEHLPDGGVVVLADGEVLRIGAAEAVAA